ncbi:hypothetical protein [Dendronalium sp. ChiSLP03b]|uniref:hypothetical protein n=1 Tax=Dendronalium sp. ChiSLP03b TaxID=3075381 RepID=UPI002AD4D527|nr:hypothetical protein [Dendronalium sp. ChiSLP03b]MDZ8207434.1 hypothetical protein [Dendronalium sp. ChiSLP03b]
MFLVKTRQMAEGRWQKERRFEVTLLSVTYFGLFAPFYLIWLLFRFMNNINRIYQQLISLHQRQLPRRVKSDRRQILPD